MPQKKSKISSAELIEDRKESVLWINASCNDDDDCPSELDWVNEQIKYVVGELVEANWSYQNSTLGSLTSCSNAGSNVSMRVRATHRTDSDSLSGRSISHIYIASSNRSDDVVGIWQWATENYPGAEKQVVLGRWWPGHRRSWPLRDIKTSYWYQCQDQLIPGLYESKRFDESVIGDSRKEVGSSAKLGLVYAIDTTSRKFWSEVLPSMGYTPLAINQLESLPEGDVRLVLIDADCAEENWQNGPSFKSLRTKYPRARIAGAWGFPEWTEVASLLGDSMDIVLGKPFDLFGLKKLLEQTT